jgi:hypothetical protein
VCRKQALAYVSHALSVFAQQVGAGVAAARLHRGAVPIEEGYDVLVVLVVFFARQHQWLVVLDEPDRGWLAVAIELPAGRGGRILRRGGGAGM